MALSSSQIICGLVFLILVDFSCGWRPISMLFQQRVLVNSDSVFFSEGIKPLLKRSLNIHSIKMFGEEVKENPYFKKPYPKERFSTVEEENAYLLNNSVEFDTSKLPRINLTAELEEQKAKRTYYGEKDGMDDPRDAPWRLKAERIIQKCIEQEAKVRLYDITWNVFDLLVVIEPLKDEPPVSLELITDTSSAIESALSHFELELDILGRHELYVGTRGVSNHLICERDYKAFRGFEVDVQIKVYEGTERREPVRGRLMDVSVNETILAQRGRKVMIPNFLVENITLPPALYEPKDIEKKFKRRH